MSREFVKGCTFEIGTAKYTKRADKDDWAPVGWDAKMPVFTDWQVERMGLTVTWPEPGPSVVEGTWLMTEGRGEYDAITLSVPKRWARFGPDGLDLLVIRKDRVVSDKLTTPGAGYNVPGASTARVIVVLEAE